MEGDKQVQRKVEQSTKSVQKKKICASPIYYVATFSFSILAEFFGVQQVLYIKAKICECTNPSDDILTLKI